jgi:hypothetical protein
MSVTGHRRRAGPAGTRRGDGSPASVGLTCGRARFEADLGHYVTRPGPIRYTNVFRIFKLALICKIPK